MLPDEDRLRPVWQNGSFISFLVIYWDRGNILNLWIDLCISFPLLSVSRLKFHKWHRWINLHLGCLSHSSSWSIRPIEHWSRILIFILSTWKTGLSLYSWNDRPPRLSSGLSLTIKLWGCSLSRECSRRRSSPTTEECRCCCPASALSAYPLPALRRFLSSTCGTPSFHC